MVKAPVVVDHRHCDGSTESSPARPNLTTNVPMFSSACLQKDIFSGSWGALKFKL